MSNLSASCTQQCSAEDHCPSVELLIKPGDKDLGGFSVRRALPTSQRKLVGPWIFFDHIGPAQFPAGQGINVRPHPHINLATVTYLFEGEILHRDSLGNDLSISPGDINLMVAGKGIVHSERERTEVRAQAHALHGLQLWLALPVIDEEIEPAFYHYSEKDIPRLDVDGVPVRIMMGSAYGVTSPVLTFADTLYLEAHLQAGQSLALPESEERAVYVAEGKLMIGETLVPEHSMAILRSGTNVHISARSEALIVLVGGENVGERFIEWNFVSSRKERIEQAKRDWKQGAFPTVPGDDEEFIPLPE